MEFGHKKKWNLPICDTMDGPWGHYFMWNKPDTERQIPYDYLHMESKKTKPKTLCKFKVYNMMISHTYMLQNDYHNGVS